MKKCIGQLKLKTVFICLQMMKTFNECSGFWWQKGEEERLPYGSYH